MGNQPPLACWCRAAIVGRDPFTKRESKGRCSGRRQTVLHHSLTRAAKFPTSHG